MELFSELPLEKLIEIFSNKTLRHIELRKEIIDGDMADASIAEYYVLEDELSALRLEIYKRYKKKYAAEGGGK